MVYQQIFSIFYGFQDKRGQSGEKNQFCKIWKFFLFHVILMVFFPNYSLWKMQPKITLVLRIMRVKMILSSYGVFSPLLCPALYCVQNFTVSSTMLCQIHYCVQQNTVSTLTQRIFCWPFMHILSCCGCIMLRLLAPLFCFVFCLFSFLQRLRRVSFTFTSYLLLESSQFIFLFLLFKVDVFGR